MSKPEYPYKIKGAYEDFKGSMKHNSHKESNKLLNIVETARKNRYHGIPIVKIFIKEYKITDEIETVMDRYDLVPIQKSEGSKPNIVFSTKEYVKKSNKYNRIEL